ncbi:unnamed protein product [Protopolystoma xenopodis]|uniref:Uncharacterized protein n=1 Tax=Protopolystoma xenopodis TaxID=117903 RepID=A0A448X559_9PLAT|nr:unnamed protein product [Protopolystoma xenopodis]
MGNRHLTISPLPPGYFVITFRRPDLIWLSQPPPGLRDLVHQAILNNWKDGIKWGKHYSSNSQQDHVRLTRIHTKHLRNAQTNFYHRERDLTDGMDLNNEEKTSLRHEDDTWLEHENGSINVHGSTEDIEGGGHGSAKFMADRKITVGQEKTGEKVKSIKKHREMASVLCEQSIYSQELLSLEQTNESSSKEDSTQPFRSASLAKCSRKASN